MQSKRFRIVAAKNLSKEQMSIVEKSLPEWIKYFEKFGWKCRRKSGALFRRGIFGYCPTELLESGITFKRLSKHRIFFGFVKIEDLEFRKPFEKSCMCGEHMGGQRAILKNHISIDNDFVTLYDSGE